MVALAAPSSGAAPHLLNATGDEVREARGLGRHQDARTPVDYARLGLFIGLLCWPDEAGACACGRGHTGNEAAKAPLTPRGHLGFSNDPEQVEAWVAQYPLANWGVDLERSGLLVIDPDSDEASDEVEAEGYHPRAVVVRTGRGR